MGNARSAHHKRHHRLCDKYRNPKRMIHCLVVGDDASGRTNLIMRYLANELPPPTADLVPVYNKACYTLIARQHLYNIALYNAPEHNPLEELDTRIPWFPEGKRHAPHVPIILAGIYSDIRDDLENSTSQEDLYDAYGNKLIPIPFNEGVSLGERIGAAAYIECSLDSGLGVEQIFYEAAKITRKGIPLEIGVKDYSVAHRDTIAMKRYNFQHEYLVSHKLFLENQ